MEADNFQSSFIDSEVNNNQTKFLQKKIKRDNEKSEIILKPFQLNIFNEINKSNVGKNIMVCISIKYLSHSIINCKRSIR